jgi:hypothetical protein
MAGVRLRFRARTLYLVPVLTFVAADENLLAAAHSEGLATENPNDHP